MPDLLIKETELENLVKFVNDQVPTKFGLPILRFIEETAQTREKENTPQETDGKQTNSKKVN
jgi:hypothetical protein